jgi:beta-galactosidase
MKTGASYYPEVLPETDWAKDLKTGKEIGLSVLRCGEFAWNALFTPDGKATMEWTRRFLDTAHANGYEVVWCTPSATPPPYLFDRWPDLHATSSDGLKMPVGIRRNYCPSHAGYLELCAETAGKLVRELGDHPALRGWQVDNELAGDGFTCWCERCGTAFQKWLEKRHGTLEQLNEAWQTSVWSQAYTRWEQIPVPLLFRAAHTPALKLAWRRFRSDCWLNFYRQQADALREAGARCVTTNFFNMTWDVPFDRWTWRPHLDAIGLSHYLEGPVEHAFELAVLQGPQPGEKPVWVLEQKAGQQASQNLLPDDPTRLERHLAGCAEAGAEYGIYWHFRQHAAGCEMEHGAVLRHDGQPTRIARAIGAAIQGSSVKTAKLAHAGRLLIFSFNQHWANETRPPTGAVYDYRAEIEKNWFAAAHELFGNIRIGNFSDVTPDSQLILAPFFQLNEPGAASAFRSALEAGATLITTVDFLRLDNENNVRRLAPLAGIADWIQVPELEVYQLKTGTLVQGKIAGQTVQGGTFWGILETQTEGVSSYQEIGSGHCEGCIGPMALAFPVKRGRLIIALTALDAAGVRALIDDSISFKP